MKWIPALVLALMALAACGGPSDSPQVPAGEPGPSSAATDCGRFDLPQGGGLPDSAVQCLIDAVDARRPAQLTTTILTVEGDPIPIAYTAGAEGSVEVITDSRQDNFGEKVRRRMTCAGPTRTPGESTITFAQCSASTIIPER